MYLRRYSKKADGEEYGYWSLVESVRTARGPRQRVVASIGKLPGLDKEAGKNIRLNIEIYKNEDRYQWALQSGGNYILRTNWKESDPKTIWKRYIQLTEVEDAFRTEKNDLGMRPRYCPKKIH